MPNRSQIFAPDIPVHVILRSANSRPCFYAAEDYRNFMKCLQDYAIVSSCSLHAYALMSNHIHILLTPAHKKSVVNLIRQLGEFHTQYINRTYRRNESLLGQRFSCYLIHEQEYFLRCQRYIEMNPVRGGIVNYPGEYPWSSYRANAHGINSSPITPHPLYLLLGNSQAQRMKVYREMFENTFGIEEVLSLDCTGSGIDFSDA
jgi:putative transposase